jgi:glycosyltransferase involved in cell wall biosynthesis
LKILKESGINNVRLKFAGYGELIPELIEYSKELEVEESVEFVGHLTFDELRSFFLTSSLMIFPTISEGLPRCIIEAGATGLPCISTPVGGIPELLPNNLLFNPKDAQKFASSVISIIEDNKLYEKISKDLFELSQEFNRTILTNRRTQFYRNLQSSQKVNQLK